MNSLYPHPYCTINHTSQPQMRSKSDTGIQCSRCTNFHLSDSLKARLEFPTHSFSQTWPFLVLLCTSIRIPPSPLTPLIVLSGSCPTDCRLKLSSAVETVAGFLEECPCFCVRELFTLLDNVIYYQLLNCHHWP